MLATRSSSRAFWRAEAVVTDVRGLVGRADHRADQTSGHLAQNRSSGRPAAMARSAASMTASKHEAGTSAAPAVSATTACRKRLRVPPRDPGQQAADEPAGGARPSFGPASLDGTAGAGMHCRYREGNPLAAICPLYR